MSLCGKNGCVANDKVDHACPVFTRRAMLTTEGTVVSTPDNALEIMIKDRDTWKRKAMDLEAKSRARNVREFHGIANQPVRTFPAVPTDEEVRFRVGLQIEEGAKELIEACFDLTDPGAKEIFDCAMEDIGALVKSAPLRIDLPDLVDALEDIDYVTEGFRAHLGVDGEAVHRIVHAKNMEKVADPDGKKAIKPPGWTPPDIHAELIRQGWVPDDLKCALCGCRAHLAKDGYYRHAEVEAPMSDGSGFCEKYGYPIPVK